MIIGQFNDSFPPAIDGVANVAINYCRILNESFGKCYMVTPRYSAALNDYPFEILAFKSFCVPFRKGYRWGIARLDFKFWDKLYHIPFDIIHAHSPFSAGLAAQQIARAKGLPFIATLHTKYKEDFLSILKSETLVKYLVLNTIKKFYENADDVWTVNESAVDILREYGYKGEVFVIHNGSDMPITARDEKTRMDIIKAFHLNTDGPLFIYVGQHIKQKNIYLIIDALNILNKEGLAFAMLFIGDGPARKEFEDYVDRLGLNAKVRFAGLLNDRELLCKIYASAKAMLFPSLYDTSSLVPREAAFL